MEQDHKLCHMFYTVSRIRKASTSPIWP